MRISAREKITRFFFDQVGQEELEAENWINRLF